ncbi:MAG: hypothetical protein WB680_22840 [Candidatus Acidiferrales bacterium]
MRASLRTVFTVSCCAVALFAGPSPANAQEPAPTPAPTAAPSSAPAPAVVPVATTAAPAVAPAAPPSERLVLKEGTDVPLVFSQDLNSKTAVDDDTVNMTLAEDLKVGDVVVVRKGALAVATVTNAKKAGMMGRPGELSIRLEYLKSDDQRLHLRGNKGKEGEGKVGATVALTVLFGPIGLIKHGKNVDIPQGTPLTAYVDQDYALAPAK